MTALLAAGALAGLASPAPAAAAPEPPVECGFQPPDYAQFQCDVNEPDKPPVPGPGLPPGGPTKPNCDFDPPLGQACVPGPREQFEFLGTDPSKLPGQTHVQCTVVPEGATPPNPGKRVRFRTRVTCNVKMRSITVNTRLVNALGGQVGSAGSTYYCHATEGCGTGNNFSYGEVQNLASGTYRLLARVRLSIDEPGPHDPWGTVYGTTPAGTPAGEECAPGTPVVTCEIPLDITLADAPAPPPVGPVPPVVGETAYCAKQPGAPGCPLFIPRP